jgi:acyl-CoA thioester hydrolase
VTHRHTLRIRYGECDMQRVVFAPNYLAYIDDATDSWFREALGGFETTGFDFMVKKATVEWRSAARFGDTLELDQRVSRWGTTSFEVTTDGHVGDRPVLVATLVYVSTVPGEARAQPVPEWVRAALDDDAPGSPA